MNADEDVGKQAIIYCLAELQTDVAMVEVRVEMFQKAKNRLPLDPAILLLFTCPQGSSYSERCIQLCPLC